MARTVTEDKQSCSIGTHEFARTKKRTWIRGWYQRTEIKWISEGEVVSQATERPNWSVQHDTRKSSDDSPSAATVPRLAHTQLTHRQSLCQPMQTSRSLRDYGRSVSRSLTERQSHGSRKRRRVRTRFMLYPAWKMMGGRMMLKKISELNMAWNTITRTSRQQRQA